MVYTKPHMYMYIVHISPLQIISRNLYTTGNYTCMPHALFELCAKLFYTFVLFMLRLNILCVTFELTIDLAFYRIRETSATIVIG